MAEKAAARRPARPPTPLFRHRGEAGNEVKILRGAGMCVKREGIPAHDQIFNFLIL